MNAPLSRHLTRFGAPPPSAAPIVPVTIEPTVTLGIGELETRLEAARDDTRAAADLAHRDAIAALSADREAALASALAEARAGWCAAEADAAAACVERAFAELRQDLAEKIARVLRPLLAAAAIERTAAALCEALERLLVDPARPPIAVRGPADLIAAIRARAPDLGVALVTGDTVEAVVLADGASIETRLEQALATLADTEL